MFKREIEGDRERERKRLTYLSVNLKNKMNKNKQKGMHLNDDFYVVVGKQCCTQIIEIFVEK